MSKFENVTVNGGSNQFGDSNTQNNVTNNHHHHNINVQGSNGSEIIPLVIGAVAGLAALIWWFFSHIDEVYYYLNVLTISSAALSAIALITLIFRGEAVKDDVLRFFCSAFIALGLFGLSILSREHAPNDIIKLSLQATFTDFWRGLNGHEKDLVVHNFTAAIAIALAAFFAHLVSFRRFG